MQEQNYLPAATKCKCTTTGHKCDTELQAETRCHDAVEPLPFPVLLHGMRNKNCHTSIYKYQDRLPKAMEEHVHGFSMVTASMECFQMATNNFPCHQTSSVPRCSGFVPANGARLQCLYSPNCTLDVIDKSLRKRLRPILMGRMTPSPLHLRTMVTDHGDLSPIRVSSKCQAEAAAMMLPSSTTARVVALLHGMRNKNCHTSIYKYQDRLPKKTAPYHDVEDLTCSRVFIWKIS